jgi:PHD/YefM family antitoxin component YafN of YafNO toxin-antitoxin module
MRVYTYSQARQSFAAVLEEARRRGRVAIRRRDGQTFILRPETRKDSPLDVPGLDLNLSRHEIVAAVRESRKFRVTKGRA